MLSIQKNRTHLNHKILSSFIAFFFFLTTIISPGYAQMALLPSPGTMVTTTARFTPLLVQGISINPNDPLQFDFFLNPGDTNLEAEALKEESTKLIKYFLASVTVPEDELWVNLSPYEKDRMIPQGFGQTEMGRDLLAQDYILKQLTASMMYPEKELGKKFWDRIYKKVQKELGTTTIPVNTFNKVWIVPDKAVVYEHELSGPARSIAAFVVESHLKVMLAQDYVAQQHNRSPEQVKRIEGKDYDDFNSPQVTQVIREVLIPAIEEEVNHGQAFAQLRQIYNSSILAIWYKQNLKDSLLNQVYADKNKIKGIDLADKDIKDKIYHQYLEAFKKGVYNYIKEDTDPITQQIIPRKYFSGGTTMASSPILEKTKKVPPSLGEKIKHMHEFEIRFAPFSLLDEPEGQLSLPSKIIELINPKDHTGPYLVNLRQVSKEEWKNRISIVDDNGKEIKQPFVPSVEYEIFRGADNFGRLTIFLYENFIEIGSLDITEKFIDQGIGYTVFNWLMTEASLRNKTLRMKTNDKVELRLLQEMLADIRVGAIGTRFNSLKNPNDDINNDPVVNAIQAAGKEVEVRGRPKPAFPIYHLGPSALRTIKDLGGRQRNKGKTAFVRADYSDTFEGDEITAPQRISATISTIARSFSEGIRLVIIATHVKRPKGKVVEGLSPAPVVNYLKHSFPSQEVIILPQHKNETGYHYLERVKKYIKEKHPMGILLLDNTRFDERETSKDPKQRQEMAQQYKALTDVLPDGTDDPEKKNGVFINDAFSAAHRRHASVYETAYQFEPEDRAVGISFLREYTDIRRIEEELAKLKVNEKSLAVIAGSKLGGPEGKLFMVAEFGKIVDSLMVGGLIGAIFLKKEAEDRGLYSNARLLEKAKKRLAESTGDIDRKNLAKKVELLQAESNELQEVRKIEKIAQGYKDKGLRYKYPSIPVDFVARPIKATADNPHQDPIVITRDEFLSLHGRKIADYMIIDEGPESIEEKKKIARDSKFIFWNGSLGKTDEKDGKKATREFAQFLASLSVDGLITVISGGNSIADAADAGLDVNGSFTIILLGGGAAQATLIGEPIPGLQPLLYFDSGGPASPGPKGRSSGRSSSPVAAPRSSPRQGRGSSPVAAENKGGIDLNPAFLDLQIKRDEHGVPLPLPQQPIYNMKIDGFVPVIINIAPALNLPFLLGLADTQPLALLRTSSPNPKRSSSQNADEIAPIMKAREPEQISSLN